MLKNFWLCFFYEVLSILDVGRIFRTLVLDFMN